MVRKIEQGKTNLNMDKVNLVLEMFGHELAPVNKKNQSEWGREDILDSTTNLMGISET